MKTLSHIILALAATATLSAQTETNTPKTFRYTGTVVDAQNRPVAGAVVECYKSDSRIPFLPSELELKQRAAAGSNGVFELQLTRTTTLLLARKPGLAPAWKMLTPTRDLEERLVLTPPAVLAGVVVDETDKPVAGTEVFVTVAITETLLEGGRRTFNYLRGKPARDSFTARTTADGRFRIDGFPTNAGADLTVRAPGKALRELARESLGPDTLRCRAGQEDIRLVVEPAGRIEGKILTDESASPLPLAQLRLQASGPISYSLEQREPDQSETDGAFRMNDVPAGSYRLRALFGTNAVPEWVAETVSVSVDSGQTTRGVEVTATRGGLLEVAVHGKPDRKPLAQIGLNAYKQTFQTGTTSSDDGKALVRLPPGDYQLSAFKEGWRSENSSASVEAGKTNRVEFDLAPPPKIRGIVRRPDGKPAAKLPVQIVGGYSDEAKNETDTNGKFEMEWNPQRYGQDNMTFCLLIRDPERNLAVAQEVDEETGPLDLQLASGLILVGRAECDGQPVTNASAVLVFWTGNRGVHLYGLSTGTNVPGRFEVPAVPPGRKYGLYVSASGYGQKYINLGETESEAKRIEVDPVELKPANRMLAGTVFDADDKPVANAYVYLSGDGQPNTNTRTDREGRFRFDRVCEGDIRLSANARNSYGSLSAAAGDTNVVLRLGESSSSARSKSQKLKGIVTGPDGQPVVGAQVAVFPSGSSRWIKTGTNGAFNLTWTIESWRSSSDSSILVVRDPAHHLAAAEELLEETTNLNVQLKPALTLSGRVEGPDSTPLTNAQVGVWLLAGRTYSQVEEQLATTDTRGRFQIADLPVGQDYTVFAKAKDHGRRQQKVQLDSETNRVELEPFVLKLADKILAGQVVNSDDKPVSGANVSASGEDQPETFTSTDSKGRFKFQVCEGQVRLHANSQSGYASFTVDAGDTNVVIQLARSESATRQPASRSSLKGKPLPEVTALGISAADVPVGKPVLICLFDFEQRPSRRCLRLLSEQHDALRQKGLAVVAVQAAAAEAEALKVWKETNPVPFAVGRVADKSDKSRWASGVESLPWLILSDAKGRVAAEGFALDELETQLRALAK